MKIPSTSENFAAEQGTNEPICPRNTVKAAALNLILLEYFKIKNFYYEIIYLKKI